MIQILCILIPLVGLTVITPFIQRKYSPKLAKRLILCMFGIYVLGNLYFTIFSRTLDSGQHLELQPFRTYGRLFEEDKVKSTATGLAALFLGNTLPIEGLILNIFLYYPIGYILPVLFPKIKPKSVIFFGLLCSLATEATQFLLKMGWCETDDVIHNTLGTAIGVWVLHLQLKYRNIQEAAR